MQKSGGNKEKTGPKYIPPFVGEFGTGGPSNPDYVNAPQRDAEKKNGKVPVYDVLGVTKIYKSRHAQINCRSYNRCGDLYIHGVIFISFGYLLLFSSLRKFSKIIKKIEKFPATETVDRYSTPLGERNKSVGKK
jgi:hypothetical protein